MTGAADARIESLERTSPERARTRRKALIAGATGNIVEWFDFTIYGFSAAVLATVFFPAEFGSGALLATFALYGVAFLARPAGGVVFGRLGDRFGRRGSLSLAITLMGCSTAAIGLLPTYASIGAAAPLLLLVCRLVQGFSAGGEYTGAATFVVEHAPYHRRGLYAGIIAGSSFVGSILATITVLTFNSVGTEYFLDGGWRWPFIIGGVVAIAGLFMRLAVDETPAFTEMKEKEALLTRPLADLLRNHWRSLVTAFVYFASLGVATHMLIGYMPTFLTHAAGVSSTAALMLTSGALVLAVPLYIAFGATVDRIGRRPLVRIGMVASVLVAVPSYVLIGTGNIVAIAGALIVLVIVQSLLASALLAVLEMMPTNARFTGTALPYNLAYALFAGTAPLVCETLVNSTGSNLSPAFYATAVASIALPVLWRGIPESRIAGTDRPLHS
ncbi:MFS transporter [Rhodococcoides fascians]|uniref:MFS transporter n=1 Tax=Rhodococcoides fascians TaxID=1828 RepID=UPI0006897CEE|nr:MULTISPECIES: MFS transporter [Rhodococcus]OZD72931.1 MFS transporter [Rhodococcus sp. 06-1059B-a]